MPPKTDPDATSGQKLLVLYTLLIFSGGEFSLTELAEELHCSKQTVLRLLDQMEAGGVRGLVRETRGGRAYYHMLRPARRPVLALSPEGLEQLVLCRDLALHLLPGDMRAKLEQALERASALLPEGGDAREALLSGATALTKGWIDYTPFQGFLERMRTAMRRKTAISVSYRSVAREQGRTFDFAPRRLLSFREAMYVQGWEVTGAGRMECLYDNPLTLAVHRLLEANPTRRSFAGLDLPPLPDEDTDFGFAVEAPFRARVRFARGAAAAYVRERRWSADQEMGQDNDGNLILDFTSRSRDEVSSWVLGFGAQAELLAPEDLREQLGRVAAAMAEAYGAKPECP